MSMSARSLFLQWLLANEETRKLSTQRRQKRIQWIMADLERSNIFSPLMIDEDKELEEIELEKLYQAYFGRGTKEFMESIRNESNCPKEVNDNLLSLDSLSRIRQKRIELSKDPRSGIVLTSEDLTDVQTIFSKENSSPINAYGRTPLHEAIALREIETIKKYVREGRYINSKDNNGNSPYDMAVQEGYEEAVKILKVVKMGKKVNIGLALNKVA